MGIFIYCSLSIPFGISTSIFFICLIFLLPPHFSHFSAIIFPEPSHLAHVAMLITCPKTVLWIFLYSPAPPHSKHSFKYPDFAPVPLHDVQLTNCGTSIVFLNPEKASSELHGEGTWTMPGGKMHFHEEFEDAAKREINIKNWIPAFAGMTVSASKS